MNQNQQWETKKSHEEKYKRLLMMIGGAILYNVKDLQDINSIQNVLSTMILDKDKITSVVTEIMIKIRNNNDRVWKPYIRQAEGSKEIYAGIINQITKSKIDMVMNNIIEHNVNMITDLPQTVSKHVSNYIKQQTLKGVRSSDMIEDIKKKIPNITDNNARLISRTQVSMTQSALTEARSESLGLRWYRWRSSEDERVRSSHSNLEGVLISWDNPPSPESLLGQKSIGDYHAGMTFRCRCYSEPVINPERLPNIVRVYIDGQITTMGKREFIDTLWR